MTKLQEANNYNALWSYKIDFAGNKQCNDISYAKDGSAAIFMIDNVDTANNKVVHLGHVKDLITQSATPTINMMTLTSGDNVNAPIQVGINFSELENESTVYMVLRTSDFSGNGLNFLKLDLNTPTVTIH